MARYTQPYPRQEREIRIGDEPVPRVRVCFKDCVECGSHTEVAPGRQHVDAVMAERLYELEDGLLHLGMRNRLLL